MPGQNWIPQADSLTKMDVAVLTPFLVVGCYTDINYRRIPNYITFGLIVAGLAINAVAGPGLLFSASGILTGLILFMLPFLFCGMGAGDVKLMMGVGAVVGGQTSLYIGMLSSGIAAAYAMVLFAKNGKLKELFNFTKSQALYILAKTQVQDYTRETVEGKTIPYAVPILISTAAVLLWGWL